VKEELKLEEKDERAEKERILQVMCWSDAPF